MADWFNTLWWPNVLAVVGAAWPEVVGKTRMDVSIERFDWINMLNDDELTVPWCVVTLSQQPTTDWFAGPCWQIDAQFWYITSLEAAATANVTAASLIEGKLIDLQRGFYAAQTVGTVDDGVTYDVSATDPVNTSFLEAGLLYQAGSLKVTFIVAVTAQ